MSLNRMLCLALATGALTACGDSSSPSSTSTNTSARGQLIGMPAMTTSLSAQDMLTNLSTTRIGEELLSVTFTINCTVTVYHIEYGTVGGKGESTTASAALMVPSGILPSCQGPRPIVMYAHGTSPDKAFNLADVLGPDSTEGLLMAALFAGDGYIVVAPNYAGYDTSTLPYHPYLNAEQQSDDMIDSLAAAQSALSSLSASSNGKLFITGYSQGGFVAMATHRAMQAAGMTVTASGPMSGPYALGAFGDAIFEGEVDASATENVTLLATSYQRSYGNLYTDPSQMFEAPYASDVDGLLPSTTPLDTLYSQGKLPQNALFSSTPPADQYASMTPATQPAYLAPVFAAGFGTPNLVTNSFRLAYLQDAAAQPDGGFPTVTTGVPAAAPGAGVRQDLKMNDLRNWVPTVPVLLCGGANDPTVFFPINTGLMQNYWTQNAPANAPITVLDLESSPLDLDPYAAEKAGFATAKAAVLAVSGDDGVRADYHATLVPPFCFLSVKSFFDSVLSGAAPAASGS